MHIFDCFYEMNEFYFFVFSFYHVPSVARRERWYEGKMGAIIDEGNTIMKTVCDWGVMPEEASPSIETTLYDLMEAMYTAIEPDEEELVVGTVVHLLRSGRITFLGTPEGLDSAGVETACVSHLQVRC